MDMQKEIKDYAKGISEVYARFPVEEMEKIVKALMKAYEDGKKIITMGNGGHASTASHLINDLAKHTIVSDKKDEIVVTGKRFKTLCLNDNVATLTSWANDVSFDDIFSQQLLNWVEEGDIVMGITGSGNSENIVRAFKAAKDKGAVTIALTGYQGGRVKDIVDICFIVPSDVISYIEDIHFSMTHMWCDIMRMIIQGRG